MTATILPWRRAFGTTLAALALVAAVRADSYESQLLSALPVPTIANPSFEANALSFTTSPGYVGGTNPATITGWTGGSGLNGTGVGMSNAFSSGSPIPGGVSVAFLQAGPGSPRTLSQVISGFEGGAGWQVGGTYQISFRYNSRSFGTPDLNVTISDGVNPAVSLFSVAGFSQNAGSYYTPVTIPFVATASSMTLSFTATANADETVLLDLVTLAQLQAGSPVVPEPSSVALFGAALCGLAGWAWRRRR